MDNPEKINFDAQTQGKKVVAKITVRKILIIPKDNKRQLRVILKFRF